MMTCNDLSENERISLIGRQVCGNSKWQTEHVGEWRALVSAVPKLHSLEVENQESLSVGSNRDVLQ